MKRRTFIEAVGTTSMVSLGGCLSNPPTTDNVQNTAHFKESEDGDKMYIRVKSQYACNDVSAFPEKVGVKILLFGDGDIIYEDLWEFDPVDCMVKRITERIITLDKEYDTMKIDAKTEYAR